MSDLSTQARSSFFSSNNEAMLDRVLYNDFQRRIGGDLNEKQKERLVKTVRHYMNQVWENMGEQPTTKLNTEVLSATVPDFNAYMRRQGGSVPVEPEKQDVSSRFSQIQNERQEAKAPPPTAPDFRIALDEGAPPALNLFEQMKKQREAEAQREAALQQQQQPAGAFMDSAVTFKQSADAAKKRDELSVLQRDAERASQRRNVLLSMPPDPRALYFPTGQTPGPPAQNLEDSGLGQTNPTLALPEAMRLRSSLPQDIIKKQDDIVSYRENEYNLFIYSSDRDWTVNALENRYNFSVNFDPANNRPGFSYSTAANIKFKNIVRIELVKVIVPTEGIDILATQHTDMSYNTDLNINVLSFPYLMLRIPELDTNNYGTNNNLDNAFGVIQYDANWISDSSANNRGYLAMIPKFMKCQKSYYPTPLATLQKLTIQLQRPDGTSVSDTLDTLDVSGVLFSSQLKTWPSTAKTTGTLYADVSGSFLWIQTKTWFNKFAVSQADRIRFQNVTFPSTFAGTAASTADFVQFLTRAQGHVVIDTAKFLPPASVYGYSTGANIQGYCNYIIIRNSYADPSTGSTSLTYYGGTSATDSTFRTALKGAAFATGRLINLNHQTSVVLRVITRDMDAASRLRPDNNF